MKIITCFLISSFTYSTLVYSYENQNTISFQAIRYEKKYASASQLENQLSFLSENFFQLDENSKIKFSPILNLEQESQNHSSFLDLDSKEIIYNYASNKINFDVGFLNLKKEGPDLFDVWGYFQPKNYRSLLNVSTLPILGLSTEYELSKSLTLTGAFIPYNRISKLPSMTSPWLPRENKLPLAGDDTLAILPGEPVFQTERNAEEKKQDLQNNYLVRLKYSGDIIDAIVQISESLSTTPNITPTLNGQLTSLNPTRILLENPILLDFKWKKNKNYGLGLNCNLNSLGIITKWYSNYNLTPDDELIQSVIGVEKQYNDLIVIYEYTKTTKKNNFASTEFATTSSLFSNAHAAALVYSFSDALKLRAGVFMNSDMNSNATLLSAKFQFNDSWSSDIQYLNIAASSDSILNLFEDNDALSIKLITLF